MLAAATLMAISLQPPFGAEPSAAGIATKMVGVTDELKSPPGGREA